MSRGKFKAYQPVYWLIKPTARAPLYEVMGYYNKEKEYTIEPLLKNVDFLELSDNDALKLLIMIQER